MAKSNRTHSFDIELASIIGIERAIIVSNIDYWCTENELKSNKEYFYYGSYWTKESLTSLAKKYPYMKRASISRWISELSISGWIKMIQTKDGNICQRGEKFKRWNAGLPIELTVSQNETVNEVSQNGIVAMSQNETQGGVSKWDTNNIDLINIDSLNVDLPANAAEPEKENPNIPLKAKKEKTDTPGPRRAAKIRTGRNSHTWNDTLHHIQKEDPAMYLWAVQNAKIWADWMEYRSENKKCTPYGSAKTEYIAIKQLYKFADGRPEKAQAVVDQTRANGWQGMVALKPDYSKQTNRPQTGHPNGVNPYTY